MKRTHWIPIAAVLVLAGAALGWMFMPSAVSVDTARIERGVFTLAVEEDGITRVRDRYVVTSPVTGMLMRVSLRAGDPVRRGDVVATIVPNAAQMLDARSRSELAAQVE